MAPALAFTQFILIGIGALLLHLLVKSGNPEVPGSAMVVFTEYLARHVLWLFAIPIIYAAIGNGLKDKLSAKAIQSTGITLCVLLLLLLGIPIGYYLL